MNFAGLLEKTKILTQTGGKHISETPLSNRVSQDKDKAANLEAQMSLQRDSHDGLTQRTAKISKEDQKQNLSHNHLELAQNLYKSRHRNQNMHPSNIRSLKYNFSGQENTHSTLNIVH